MQSQKEIIRGLHNLRPEHRGCVVTIGAFDGVHLGHQAILRQVTTKAASLNLPSTVVVFEPLPAEFFAKPKAPARLMRFREKVEALFENGIDRVLCLYFNNALRSLSASEFVSKVVVGGLQPRYVVIGDDFHFGRDRSGELETLRQAGQVHGFEVDDTQTYAVQGDRVSSTRVREALEHGHFDLAAQLLGRPYCVSGRVAYGRQLGQQLGVPTANLPLHRKCSPLYGVFAVEVTLYRNRVFSVETGTQTSVGTGKKDTGEKDAGEKDAGEKYCGVANVGLRPTVGGDSQMLLEVHLFDFAEAIYGVRMEVNFKKKLREEQKFPSLEKLREQIHLDIDAAKQFFNSQGR